MKKVTLIAPLFGAILFTAACSDEQTTSTETSIAKYVSYTDEDFYEAWQNNHFTTIQLNDKNVKTNGANSAAVIVENQTITIKGKGTYVVQGTLTDGQLIVDAAESGTVRIILNGASITSSTTAPIFVKEADKTVLSVERGTKNSVTDAATRADDDEATGAIYSKDDLTINGDGSLTVNANAFDGIVGKDNLYITGGKLQITAADDGILGRDVFSMQNASVTIDAQGDGIKSTNEDDETMGNIVLESGTLNIFAGNDGIASVKDLIVLDGEYTIIAGGGSPETVSSGEEFGGGMMPGFNGTTGEGMQQPPEPPTGEQGNGQQPPELTAGQPVSGQQPPEIPNGGQESEQQATTEDTTPSTKGLKAENLLQIDGGTFTIDSLDDAVHSNGNVEINGGTLTINTGDDGIHADSHLTIAGGKIQVEKSYEGLEGKNITIKGGHTELTAEDDGVNVNGGSSDFGQPPAAMQNTTNTTANTDKTREKETGTLTIEDGYLFVDATGDGLDSNGDIKMTGGTAIVYGPVNGGNGALDYDGTFDLQGGVLVAAGSSGMAMGVSDTSSQNTVMMIFDKGLQASTVVTVENESDEIVAAITPTKNFQTIVISTPDLQQDGTYKVNYGGTFTGKLENGFATSGTIDNTSNSVSFTFDSGMTYLDSNGVTEKPSEFGGMSGGRPNMQNGTNGKTQQPATKDDKK